jgi:glycerol-3-phosphate dehydrogenase
MTRNVPVTLWARNPDTVLEINEQRSNETYLPGARLPDKLVATNDIGECVREADVVVMGIPSQNFRSVLEEVKKHIRAWVPVISLTKGLELDTRMRMTEIINEVLPGHPVGVLTGPNLAREIMAGQAAASVIAMEDEIIVQELQNVFKSGSRHGRRPGRRGQYPLSTHHPGPCRSHPPRGGHGRQGGDLRRPGGHGRHDRHLYQSPESQPSCGRGTR